MEYIRGALGELEQVNDTLARRRLGGKLHISDPAACGNGI